MSHIEEKKSRGLPWFRVDVDMVDHPKVDALAELLGDPLAGWYVIRLWAWTMRYAARGRLAPGARLSVERACNWRGEPGHLWSALLTIGWIEALDDGTFEVHDWQEHQGAAVVKAEKDAERKRGARTARGRRADGAGQSADEQQDESAVAAGNGTERNGTREGGSMSSPLEQQREAKPVEDEKNRWLSEADNFVAWASAQAPQLATPGEPVRRWARDFFVKYQPADRNLPRTAFAKFLLWCHQSGKAVGWGLWLSERVWEPRWAEVRAEAQRRGAA